MHERGKRRSCNRKALVKLRFGNHKLMVECGRYDQIPRENRLCPSCRSNEIEDETHFLFNCPKYFIPRDEFYNKVQFYVQNIKQLPPIEAIEELINSSNYFVNLQLVKFVLSCFDLRSKLLSI